MSGIIGTVGARSGIVGQTQSGSGLQSSFNVKLSANQDNIASGVTILFNTLQAPNIGGDFNTSTYTYTAPVTGMYTFLVNAYQENVDNVHNYSRAILQTSNRGYGGSIFDTRVWSGSCWLFGQNIGVLTEMEAGDIAFVYHNYSGGTSTTDYSSASFFSGYFTGITY